MWGHVSIFTPVIRLIRKRAEELYSEESLLRYVNRLPNRTCSYEMYISLKPITHQISPGIRCRIIIAVYIGPVIIDRLLTESGGTGGGGGVYRNFFKSRSEYRSGGESTIDFEQIVVRFKPRYYRLSMRAYVSASYPAVYLCSNFKDNS